MSQNYTPEFKKKIIRLHEEEGRTYKSITAEYGVSKASISKWCSEFSKECQTDPQAKEDYDSMKENLRLKRENDLCAVSVLQCGITVLNCSVTGFHCCVAVLTVVSQCSAVVSQRSTVMSQC